jgi:DNA replication protein DnaC
MTRSTRPCSACGAVLEIGESFCDIALRLPDECWKCDDCTREVPRADAAAFESVRPAGPASCSTCDASLEPGRDTCDDCIAKARERNAAAARAQLLADAGIPPTFASWTLASFEADRGRRAAAAAGRRWAAGELAALHLFGETGTGKTSLAAAAAMAFLEAPARRSWRRRRLYFRTAADLAAGLSAGFQEPSYGAALALVRDVGAALVLDDLDKISPTRQTATRLWEAIDGRLRNETPLLITSNGTVKDVVSGWPDHFQESIASRLAVCERHEWQGPDLRLVRPKAVAA